MTGAARNTVEIRNGHRVGVIMIPLFLLWIVFLPFMLALSPLILIACVFAEVNPFRIFSTMWQMIDALEGSEFEANRGTRSLVIRIR